MGAPWDCDLDCEQLRAARLQANTLREALEHVRFALRIALWEIEQHNSEYSHVTPEARLEEFRRLAAGVAK